MYETYGDYEFMKSTYEKYDPTRCVRHGVAEILVDSFVRPRFNVRKMDGPLGL